jgi:hypothetical protein
MQLFIARLQDGILKELMKNTYTIQAIYEAPLDFEVIQEENKPVKPIIFTADNLAKLTVEELEDVNAIWAC